MFDGMKRNVWLTLILGMAFLSPCLLATMPPVYADEGNAEVSRYRNMQFFEMTVPQHPLGNASVLRYRNLLFFETTTEQHPPGNASVLRYRNLQFFEMTPQVHPGGDALVTRTRNLQYFGMTSLGPPSATVNSFTTADQNGDPKNTFAPGAMVVFRIIVAGDSHNIPNTLVSVIVQDLSLTPIFLSYTYEDLRIGEQATVYLGFQISYDCVLGDYTAKLNLFTLLPSQGGEPIVGGHSEVHFTVA